MGAPEHCVMQLINSGQMRHECGRRTLLVTKTIQEEKTQIVCCNLFILYRAATLKHITHLEMCVCVRFARARHHRSICI